MGAFTGNVMTSTRQIKRKRVPVEEGQKSSERNSSLVESDEPLMEMVKRLKVRVELLEELAKKTSATEGKLYGVNYVLHLKICIKEQQI